jgi:hypothetical protein
VFAQAELLKLQKSGQFPDEPVRIKVGQIHIFFFQKGLSRATKRRVELGDSGVLEIRRSDGVWGSIDSHARSTAARTSRQNKGDWTMNHGARKPQQGRPARYSHARSAAARTSRRQTAGISMLQEHRKDSLVLGFHLKKQQKWKRKLQMQGPKNEKKQIERPKDSSYEH